MVSSRRREMSAWTAAPRATTSSGFSSECGHRVRTAPRTRRRTSGDRRGAADQDDLVDAGRGQAPRRRGQPAGPSVRDHDRVDHRLELGPRELPAVVRPRCGSGSVSTVSVPRRTEGSRAASTPSAHLLSVVRLAGDDRRPCRARKLVHHESTRARSKSSPPRWVSPLVASTSKMPSVELQDRDVERPAAQVVDRDHAFLPSAGARTRAQAAVGSLTIRSTSRPAMRPASFVACRWASLK